MSEATVAIVGGGPGGLTLARLLQRRGFPVTVYERDASREARSQGGTLDLHADLGQVAIRAMGLEREFAALSRPEGQATRVLDKSGLVLLDERPAPGDLWRPEIDRFVLRQMLLDSLLPDTLLWDMQILSVEPDGSGKWQVTPARGPARAFDLVVGCDGAASRVRRALSLDEQVYSGITAIEMHIPDADAKAPDIASRIGPGSFFSLGDGKALMAQRNGDGNIRVGACFAVAESWLDESGIDFQDAKAARAALRKEFQGWAEELLSILDAVDDRYQPRRYCRLPIGHRWRSRAGLTLLGDAAHLMTPFAGQGANLAMLDAVDLANHLAAPGFASPGEAQQAFEDKMCGRAEEASRETQRNQELFFGPDAARRLAQLMSGYAALAR